MRFGAARDWIRIHRRESAMVGLTALAYAVLCWALNAGREELAYDDAVLELSLEALTDRTSPYLEDPLFRSRGRTDLYRHVIRTMNRWTGDRYLSRRFLLSGLGFSLVVGSYVLWKGIFGSPALAVLGAILTSLPRSALGAEFWGVLDVEHVVARSFAIPLLPVLFLGFLRNLDRPRGALWIAAPAMVAPLHSLTTFYLTGILSLTYLIHHRFARRAVGQVAALGAALLALGFAAFAIATGKPPGFALLPRLSPEVDAGAFWHALKRGIPWAFYPNGFLAYNLGEVLSHILPMAAAMAVLLLLRWRRPGTGDDARTRILGIYAGVVLGFTLVPPYLYEEICWGLGRRPMFLEHFRPMKFVLVAGLWGILELVRILWEWPGRRLLGRSLASVLILSALIPALLESRALSEWACGLVPGERGQVARSAARQRACFADLCAWARESTGVTDRFCIGSSAFRLRAQRPILTSRMELMPYGDRLGLERELMGQIDRVMIQENGAPTELLELARAGRCRFMVLDSERARGVPPGWLPRAYSNEFYQVFDLREPGK